jgi:photosystem II stability/assembly factor-like uncharacterized protein
LTVKIGTSGKLISAKEKSARRANAGEDRRRAAIHLFVLFLVVALWMQGALWAQSGNGPSAVLEDMKLLSPGTGWALAAGKLFWTSDNGQSWDDITPGDNQQPVSKVFFLDANTGWAILPGIDSDNATMTVASTRNGGKSWRNVQLALDSFTQGRRVGGVASVSFVDAQQGWLILHLSSSSNFSFGLAFHSADGGLTWTALPAPPAAGNIVFISSQDGWMSGGPAQEQL